MTSQETRSRAEVTFSNTQVPDQLWGTGTSVRKFGPGVDTSLNTKNDMPNVTI